MFFDKNEDIENNSERATKLVIKIVVSIFVIVLGLGVYLVVTSSNKPAPSPAADTTTSEEYSRNFEQAEKLLNSGNVEQAKVLYLESLKSATTPVEVSQAQYKISLTETQTDPKSAISRLKQIIADENNTDLDRAYAAQRLGLLYYRNSDPALIPVIFSGEPYAAFYTNNDLPLALRRLFEFSSSFYPVALSELRAAIWYAQEITLDAQKAEEYLPIIESKLKNADLDIERTRYISGPDSLVTEALSLKARVYAALHRAGYEYDYETAMQEAMTYALASGVKGADGQARYAYVINLFLYEEDREVDILNLLQPMIDNIDEYPTFKRMFERERNNVLNQKKDLVALGNALPQFKNLLLSLNWTEADFN